MVRERANLKRIADLLFEAAMLKRTPRTGDHNYVYKKYVRVDEERATQDLTAGLPFADEIKGLIAEFSERKTSEALLSHDADQLALLLQLKEHTDLGSS